MKFPRLIFLIFSIALLGACHPVYETRYEFNLPDDQRGRECINDCQFTLQQCEANAIQLSEGCLYRAEQAYQTCEARKRYAPDPVKGWKKPQCVENCISCYRDYCPGPKTEICQDRYRQCYTNCGGSVTPKTECVANCDRPPR